MNLVVPHELEEFSLPPAALRLDVRGLSVLEDRADDVQTRHAIAPRQSTSLNPPLSLVIPFILSPLVLG